MQDISFPSFQEKETWEVALRQETKVRKSQAFILLESVILVCLCCMPALLSGTSGTKETMWLSSLYHLGKGHWKRLVHYSSFIHAQMPKTNTSSIHYQYYLGGKSIGLIQSCDNLRKWIKIYKHHLHHVYDFCI